MSKSSKRKHIISSLKEIKKFLKKNYSNKDSLNMRNINQCALTRFLASKYDCINDGVISDYDEFKFVIRLYFNVKSNEIIYSKLVDLFKDDREQFETIKSICYRIDGVISYIKSQK